MPRRGGLEAAVMDVLRSAVGPLSVREVRDRTPAQRRLAYTTVMTVLTNLFRKEMVSHRPVGRAYSHRSALLRHEAAVTSLREVLDASDEPRLILRDFAETASYTAWTFEGSGPPSRW